MLCPSLQAAPRLSLSPRHSTKHLPSCHWTRTVQHWQVGQQIMYLSRQFNMVKDDMYRAAVLLKRVEVRKQQQIVDVEGEDVLWSRLEN